MSMDNKVIERIPIRGNFTLINHFLIFDLKAVDINDFENTPNKDEADCIMGYCFQNHEEGMMVAIISLMKMKDNQEFISTYTGDKFFTFEYLEKCFKSLLLTDFFRIEDLKGLYEDIKYISHVSENVALSRDIITIDHLRNPYNPDIITATIVENGKDVDVVEMRIEDYDSEFNFLLCVLLETPANTPELLAGSIYPVQLFEKDGNNIKAIIDISTTKHPTEMLEEIYGEKFDLSDEDTDEMADRIFLETSIDMFREDPNSENYDSVIESIKDCTLFIPCTVDISIDDIDKCDEMISNIRSDYKLFSAYVTGKDGIKLNPRLMNMDGEKVFLPMFTSEEEIEEIDMTFTPIPIKIKETIEFVNNSGNGMIKGIVINPTSSPFVVEEEMFKEFK